MYQRGIWHFRKRDQDGITEARELFERAINIDPQFGPAFAGYARTFFYNVLFGFQEDDGERALRAAQKAVELDSEDADAHAALGRIHHINRNPDAAIAEDRMAIELNPSLADPYHTLATALVHSGRAAEAVPHLHTAIRLSPQDDLIGAFHGRLAFAHLYLRDNNEAVEWAQKAIRLRTVQWPIHACLVSALGHLERDIEAKEALQDLLEARPEITISFVRKQIPTNVADDMDHLLEGLRKAGLRE